MDGRSRLSGAAYRKKAEEKRQRESKILQKNNRLESYFSSTVQAKVNTAVLMVVNAQKSEDFILQTKVLILQVNV